MPKIVFMGTPDFAVPPFKALIEAGFDIPLLVCQPDRKKGRGHKVQFPPTKEIALENEIAVFQPESVRNSEVIERLSELNPDFFVVIAYGKILPTDLLSVPAKACINVHASLLPKWRGAAPIQYSLLNGDAETGVCTMLMDEGMDTGDLLLTKKTTIDPTEKVDQLSQRLSEMGAELIVETIRNFDSITPQKQNHDEATYSKLIKKEDRFIDWTDGAEQIFGKFRALSPNPGVVTYFRGKRLTLKDLTLQQGDCDSNGATPGEIVSTDKQMLTISCGNGLVSILSCQPESKKALAAKDFINGYQVKVGDILGG